MSRKITLFLLLSFVAALESTHAAKFGVGLRAGTQGAGAEFGVGITERFGVRAGYYPMSLSTDYEQTDVMYDGDIRFGGLGLIADFHPFKGRFHLSAGIFSNENEILLSATPTTSLDIGGTTYTPAEIGTLSGRISFNSTAPYFGLGWGRINGEKRVGLLFDLGILRQGRGRVDLTSSAGLISLVDLQAEISEIEADIEHFEFWPVASVGLAIRF